MKNKSFEKGGLTFFDVETSNGDYWFSQEIGFYDLENITFSKGDVIIDIGAHIGTTTLPTCKANPDISCIGFEASLNNYNNLIKNISENGIKNFTPNFCGVHSKTGQILECRFRSDNSGATSFFNKNVNDNSNYIPTISLDDIFKIYKLENIKVFKIDCEGAEYDILYNSEKIKNIEIEYMYLEAHDYPLQDQDPKDLIRYIEEELNIKHFKYTIINCEGWSNNEK